MEATNMQEIDILTTPCLYVRGKYLHNEPYIHPFVPVQPSVSLRDDFCLKIIKTSNK